jgi:ABC-type maltose transport system permease subunit
MAGDPGPCIRVPLRCGWGIAFLALMTVAPLAWMISTAFKRASEQFSTRLVPAHPTFGNFVAVFTQFPLLRYSLAAADRASASTSIAAPIATLSTLGSTVTRRGQPGLVPKSSSGAPAPPISSIRRGPGR